MNVIAIHEAGHAVVATFYGIHVESMELRADSGTTRLGPGPIPNRVHAAIAYAGLAAERQVDANADFTRGGMKDLRLVVRYTPDSWNDQMFDAFFTSTLATVRMLWPFITALADALVRWRRLTGEQVAQILHGMTRRRRGL